MGTAPRFFSVQSAAAFAVNDCSGKIDFAIVLADRPVEGRFVSR